MINFLLKHREILKQFFEVIIEKQDQVEEQIPENKKDRIEADYTVKAANLPERFTCTECNDKFIYESGLQKHVETSHATPNRKNREGITSKHC